MNNKTHQSQCCRISPCATRALSCVACTTTSTTRSRSCTWCAQRSWRGGRPRPPASTPPTYSTSSSRTTRGLKRSVLLRKYFFFCKYFLLCRYWITKSTGHGRCLSFPLGQGVGKQGHSNLFILSTNLFHCNGHSGQNATQQTSECQLSILLHIFSITVMIPSNFLPRLVSNKWYCYRYSIHKTHRHHTHINCQIETSSVNFEKEGII